MNQDTFITEIQKPSSYPHQTKDIHLLQTHISYVVLTGDYAYKIKKSVDFGFLDFSTLEKRKQYCDEELRLNSRLCPDLYCEVVAFTKTNDNHLEINGSGDCVEYAVKMKQFPQDRIMTRLLHKNLIKKKHLDSIIETLTAFYKKQKPTDDIVFYGQPSAIKKNIDENFEQTKDMIGTLITSKTYEYIQQINESFFSKSADVIQKRKHDGYIYDCHGDLHSGNIVINTDESICIFDCIEFNKRFRFIDSASDIGFLAMDLDYQNHPFLSSYLIQQYQQKSKDETITSLLNFYKSYRAYVRGKVLGFQINDMPRSSPEKQPLIANAQKYFHLSYYYATLLSLQIHRKHPLLFIVSGLTGTGKSTVALKLSIDYQAESINTDKIRKQLAGIPQFERHLDEPDTGLYAPERIKATYEAVFHQASELLTQGKNVILDATFQKKRYRDKARHLAHDAQATPVFIFCTAPEKTVKQWLENRLQKQSTSDGRWEIYQQQKKQYEWYTNDESYFSMDISKDSYENRFQQFIHLAHFIQGDHI